MTILALALIAGGFVGSSGNSENIRVKRQVNSGAPLITCQNLTTTPISKYPPYNLSNLSPDTFKLCPALLYDKNLRIEQLNTLASIALLAYSTTAVGRWADDILNNVSIIALGLNDTQFAQLSYSASALTNLGLNLYHIPGTFEKIVTLYANWKTKNTAALTTTSVTALQGVMCGCNETDLGQLVNYE
ncbi:hypothetical protein HELRODRAFT_166702 [Helobdella robusta]|uniref:Uncharacterized protein n=1 Tax=Helobdella robusta TaxID=6412 RepID=T1EYE2_HELRO|nr:hypothetical protein HELRODRAFT_166702 [Helobdella robusta]ESO11687.1 hypothetical protein HELRODRAFT_166702 [Helobdella robusta]